MLIIHIELFNLLIAIVSLYQLLGPKVIYHFSFCYLLLQLKY